MLIQQKYVHLNTHTILLLLRRGASNISYLRENKQAIIGIYAKSFPLRRSLLSFYLLSKWALTANCLSFILCIPPTPGRDTKNTHRSAQCMQAFLLEWAASLFLSPAPRSLWVVWENSRTRLRSELERAHLSQHIHKSDSETLLSDKNC